MNKLSISKLEFKKGNQLVYELYGLMPKKISVVEGR